MAGKLGPKVIGQKAFEAEQVEVRKKVQRFGPAVAGGKSMAGRNAHNLTGAGRAEVVRTRFKTPASPPAAEPPRAPTPIQTPDDPALVGRPMASAEPGPNVPIDPAVAQQVADTAVRLHEALTPRQGAEPPAGQPAPPSAAERAELRPAAEETATAVSLETLTETLRAEPHQVDTFLAPELTRPGGARVEAVRLLLEAEHARPEGPRANVVALLEARL